MTQQSTAVKGPILLITDLSPRCDRALDRAVALAQHHQVKLIALHVIEQSFLNTLLVPAWRNSKQQIQQTAQQRIQEDLRNAKVDVEVLVETGYPIDVIKQVAKQNNCSLIVSGTARDETLGRILLGGTVERVARESDIPLLVVRKRPEQSYGKILAATDFSESARNALSTAAQLISYQSLTVFHSFEEVGGTRELDQATINEATAHLQREVKSLVASTPAVAQASNVELVVQHGSPVKTIPAYVQDNHVDLVVLGTNGISGIVRTAMGSIAEQLLLLLRSDVLIVRAKQ